MVGISNKRFANRFPRKETHQVRGILGTDLYKEAKTIVQERIDNSNNVPKNDNLSEHLIG